MKKSIIYTSALSLALMSGVATTILLNNANAETTSNPSTLTSLTDTTTLGTSLGSKNETVYVITDTAGAPTKTFLGNILETSEPNLPVNLKITYTLDGQEISAADLAGKSGHVKVTYAYSSTQSYQGKQIPFLMLTGVQLDGAKFTNLKINNGKIISEGNTTMLAGYAIAGLSEDLDTDLIPNSFTIEADVKDFALETTYTLATNEIFADLDTSKLSTVDELISSMNQLDSGISQILDGATSLDDGLNTLVAGVKDLQSGTESLNNGANQLATGTATLSDGANNLSTGLSALAANNDDLNNGAAAIVNSIFTTASNTLNSTISSNPSLEAIISRYGPVFGITSTTFNLTTDTYSNTFSNLTKLFTYVASMSPEPTKSQLNAVAASLNESKTSLDQVNSFYTGLAAYTAGVTDAASGAEQLATGTSDLAAGAEQLLAGTTTLKSGVDTLASGAEQLSAGSHTLKDGIATFKADGIDKLVNFATNDLTNFTANLRSSVNAAKSYHSYKSTSANSVKFIFKTPSI